VPVIEIIGAVVGSGSLLVAFLVRRKSQRAVRAFEEQWKSHVSSREYPGNSMAPLSPRPIMKHIVMLHRSPLIVIGERRSPPLLGLVT
jgi:hypothetical protein